jgi:hypothetical protein
MMTGLSVDDLLASDLSLELAVDELRYRWTMQDELLATIAEELSVLIRITLQAYGAKNVQPALKIERPIRQRAPGVPAPSATNVVSFSQFKEMLGKE